MKKSLALILGTLFVFVLSASAFAINAEIPSDTQAVVAKSPAQVTVSGQLRVRAEDASTGTTGVQSQDKILQRTRLNIAADVIKNTKVFISLQDSRAWGEEANTITTGNEGQGVDLSQGYFQLSNLGGQPLSLTVGRQVLSYGDQRLIGHLEWANSGRRFDACKLVYDTKAFSLDLFGARVTDPAAATTTPAAPGDKNSSFRGLYATVKTIPNNALDLYLLQDVNNATKRDVYTYGARIAGKVSSIDYAGELAFQSGDSTATVSQSSHAYALKAGYTIPTAMNLRIGAEYDYATGNKGDAATTEAFQNLYPTNHYLYGFTDDIGWSNTSAFSVSASIKPTKDLWIGAEYWSYNLAQANAAGNKDKGDEINVMARYNVNAKLGLEATWARRTAGSAGANDYYGRAIADGDASDLVYLQALLNF